MNVQANQTSEVQEKTVIQDGVHCPGKAPWPARVSKLTSLSILPVVLLGIYILAQSSLLRLGIWLFLFAIFAYPLRYLVCARCPYYGQSCSTLMGRTVPRLFKKQEGQSMKLGLWLDVVFTSLLFVFPLPDAWRLGGLLLTLAWISVFAVMFALITGVACSACPFTFCPIGRAGRAVWGAS